MKTNNRHVLIIDDERPVLMTLEALLKRHGYQVDTAPTATQGLKALKSKPPTLVLLDLRLPDADGLEMLDRIKTELPQVQVIILTAHDSLHNAIESIKRGAYHFISKPYAPEELLSLVEKALETKFLLREAEELREKTERLEKRLEIAEARPTPIFKSKQMQEIEELIDAMAPSDANVLIVGESGVGKEVIANTIRATAPRVDQPVEAQLCGVPANDDRRRTFRLYERCVYRGDARFPRNDRSGKRRHAFPRRDIRYAGRSADALFARAPGTRVSAAWQHANNEGRLPRDRFDQPANCPGALGKPAAVRFVLPAKHIPN